MAQNFLSDIKLGDNIFIRLGDATNGDLQVFHDGNSVIRNQTGNLFIDNYQDDGDIIFRSDDGTGSQTTYFQLDGSDLNVKVHKEFRFYDNVKSVFGNSADLQIFHGGVDSYIVNETGNLQLIQKANDKDIQFFSDDGSGGFTEYFKLDGSHVRTTFAKDIKLEDNVKILAGTGEDLEIFHDGSISKIIESGSTELQISSGGSNLYLQAVTGENGIKVIPNSSVELYNNGSKKFETTSTGISVTGNIVVSGTVDGVDIAGNVVTKTGTQTISGVKTFTATTVFNKNNNQISIVDSDDNQDFRVQVNGGVFSVRDHTNTETSFKLHSNIGSDRLVVDSSGTTIAGTASATTFSGDLNGTINTATTATTQSASDNSTKVATTAYVTTAVSNLVDGAPSTLDTLNEIAAALNDDAALNTTLTNSIASKVAKAGDTMTGNLVLNNSVNLRFKNNAGAERNILTLDTNDDVQLGGSIDDIRFLTNDSSDKMIIKSDGKVGIGTDSPNALLEIYNTGAASPASSGTTQSAGNRLRLGRTDGAVLDIGSNGGNGLWLQTGNGGDLSTTYNLLLNPNGGNVGIGLTSLSNKLAVSGSMPSAGIPLIQFNETSGNARDGIYLNYTGTTNSAVYSLKIADATKTHLAVRGDGNVGIGISSPDTTLHVFKASAGSVSGNANATLTLENDVANYLNFLVPDSKETGVLFGIASNSADGGVLYNSNISRGLEFRTGGNAFRMGINSSGNVGINDVSPSKGKLQIDQESNTLSSIQLVNTAQASSNFASYPISIFFGDEQKGSSARHQASINAVREAWSNSPAALTFKTSATVNGATEKMRITSAGLVGIGTGSSVDEKLHVQGSVNNDDVAIRIENTFDDDGASSAPASALLFAAASNNGYIRLTGSPSDNAAQHKFEIGSTASGSFITFKPSGGTALTLDSSQNATFEGHVKAPFFTTDGGRGFKQDSVAFVSTYSNGNDADAVNDLGKETNRWRDLYLYGEIKGYNDLVINSIDQDKDIVFKGNQGGSTVTALTLDMSEGGNATFEKGLIVNEGSHDADFRVESNNNQYMIRVDGGNNRVGIATQIPLVPFHVTGRTLIIDESNAAGDGGAGTGGSLVIEGRRDGSANVLTLRAKDDSAASSALPNDQGAIMRWQGFDGTDFAQMGAIAVLADGQAVANSDAPSKMVFYTVPDGTETLTPALTLDKSQDATFAGQINAVGGNATTPSYIFEGDTNTGLFHPAADTIAFSTAGSERARIDSAGRFFLGHTSTLLSSVEKFSVSAGTNGINVFSSSGTGNGTLYLQNTNNSTTDWQTYLIFQDGAGNRAQFGNFYNDSKLGISGHGGIAFKTGATSLAAATTRLTITSSGLSEFEGDVKISKSTPVLTFNNLAGGGLDPSLTATGSNFTISTTSITPFSLALDDGTLTLDPGQAGKKPLKLVGNYSSAGDVKILEFVRSGDAVAGAIEYNDATTDMEIGTVTNHAFSIKTNDTRALTINNSQNVGIGDTPVTLLDVRGSSTALPVSSGTSVSGGTRFRLGSTVASTLSAVLDIGIGTSSRAWIQSTDRTDLSATNPLLLNPNGGNIGIGTSSTNATLHISDVANSGVTTFSANGRIKMSGDGVLRWGSSAAHGTLTWDTTYAKVHASGTDRELHLGSGNDSDAVKIIGSNTTFAGDVALGGGSNLAYHSGQTSTLALDDQASLFSRADETYLSQNFFYNNDNSGNGSAIETGKSTVMRLARGEFNLYFSAASVSAGATTSLQEKFKVTDAGNATFAGILDVNGAAASTFYAFELARSGSGTTTPDIWGNNNTLVLGHSASVPVITINSTATTFSGRVKIVDQKPLELSNRYQKWSFELPYFTHNTADLAADIQIPNEFVNGLIELRLQSGYSHQNAVGEAYFKWVVGLNPDGSIWYTPCLIESHVTTQAVSQIYVDDPAWDSSNNRYFIRVYHKVSSGNQWEGTLSITSQGGGTIDGNISISNLLTSTSTSSTHHHGKFLSDSSGDVAIKLKSKSAGDPTITFDSAVANRNGIINFQDQGTTTGQIQYRHNGDIMKFITGGTGTNHEELTLNETVGAVFRTNAKANAFLVNNTSAVGIGSSMGNANAAELGPGYLNLSRDDTADAKQIVFEKNDAEHSFLQTTSSGLTIGGANVTFTGTITSGALTVGNSGTSRFTDTSAFPLQISRGLDVDSVGPNGAFLSMGSIKAGSYVDAIRMSGGLAVNGTDGTFTLQTLGSGSYTTALTVDSSQNVGIGIDTPTLVAGKIVHIHGVAAGIHLTDTASGTANTDGGYVAFDNPHLFIQNKEAGDIRFETSAAERMRIDSSGVTHIMGATASSNNSLQLAYNSTAGSAEISAKSTGGNTHFEFYTSLSGTTEEKMRITSDGFVGIGTTSIPNPFSGAYNNILQVGTTSGHTRLAITSGDTKSCDISFCDSNSASNAGSTIGSISYKHSDNAMLFATNSTEKMRITSLNQVGIGTGATVRGRGLEIFRAAGSSSHPQLIISTGESSSKDYGISTDVISAGDFCVVDGVTNVANNVRLRISSGGNLNLPNQTATDSKAFSIANNAGTTGWTFGNGVIANAHQFVIYDNAAAASRFFIKSDGNIGIGMTNPWTNLVISGSGSTTTLGPNASYRLCLTNNDQTNNNYSLISFNDGAVEGGSAAMGCQYIDHTNNYGELVFATRDANGFAERMRVTSSGDVQLTTNSSKLKLRSSGSSDYTKLFRDSSNVFHIANTADTNIFSIENGGAATFTGAVNINKNTNSTSALILKNGDVSNGSNSKVQIQFGFAGTTNFSHYIVSRHNSSGTFGNALDFYVGDTTQAGVYPTHATHNLTLENGRVGIGTTSPGSFSEHADNLVISGSGQVGITIDSALDTNGNIFFADGTSGNQAFRGMIQYQHDVDSLTFYTAADLALTINSSQNATFAGNISNTSGQILPNELSMGDNKKILVGNGDDLQIYHDASNSYIETSTSSAGDLYIKSQGTNHDLYLQAADDILIRPQGGNNGIKVIGEGAVQLYHNNSMKLNTLSTGVNVVGGISASATSAITCDGTTKALRVSNVGNSTVPTMDIVTSGTASGSLSLDIYQANALGARAIRFFSGSTSTTVRGYIVVNPNNTVSYNTGSSDYRLKQNITNITGALDNIDKIQPINFKFKETPDMDSIDGFLAHEVQEVVPEAITGEKDGVDDNGDPIYQTINPTAMLPFLTAAIKELKAQNEDLIKRVKELENK